MRKNGKTLALAKAAAANNFQGVLIGDPKLFEWQIKAIEHLKLYGDGVKSVVEVARQMELDANRLHRRFALPLRLLFGAVQ